MEDARTSASSPICGCQRSASTVRCIFLVASVQVSLSYFHGQVCRCAALLYLDGVWHYTDGAPSAKHMRRFQQREDKQITSLEILAIAVGLSTFEVELTGRKVILWSDNSGAEVSMRVSALPAHFPLHAPFAASVLSHFTGGNAKRCREGVGP